MSCILKYFRFLCQLKVHKARNKLVTKDFDLKFGYRNGFLADSEALCMCPCSFNFIFLESKLSSEKIKELLINFFLGCVEAFHQISASQVERKWTNGSFFEWQSFHILLKSHPTSALIRIWFHHQMKSSCWRYVER